MGLTARGRWGMVLAAGAIVAGGYFLALFLSGEQVRIVDEAGAATTTSRLAWAALLPLAGALATAAGAWRGDPRLVWAGIAGTLLPSLVLLFSSGAAFLPASLALAALATGWALRGSPAAASAA